MSRVELKSITVPGSNPAGSKPGVNGVRQAPLKSLPDELKVKIKIVAEELCKAAPSFQPGVTLVAAFPKDATPEEREKYPDAYAAADIERTRLEALRFNSEETANILEKALINFVNGERFAFAKLPFNSHNQYQLEPFIKMLGSLIEEAILLKNAPIKPTMVSQSYIKDTDLTPFGLPKEHPYKGNYLYIINDFPVTQCVTYGMGRII